jgi:ABC-type phosphate transport system substrate-binding protein
MRPYLISLLATLALVACGGGNDVASTGAAAVSAAAPSTTTASTEPKVNRQIDERTSVAPVVAQATIAPWCSNYGGVNICGCLNSTIFGGTGRAFTPAQLNACDNALAYATTNALCSSLGGLQCSASGGPGLTTCVSVTAWLELGCSLP